MRRSSLLAQWQFALLVVAGPLCGVDSALAAALDIGSHRQLFVDDWIVDQTQNIQRQPAEVVKNPGNPILKRDKPWDQCRCDIYGSGVFDPVSKRLQIFYSAVSVTAGHDDKLAYAVSDDMGATWTKPDLSLIPFKGNSQTNLVLTPVATAEFLAGPSVFRDEHETDPAKRYKMFASEYYANTSNKRDKDGFLMAVGDTVGKAGMFVAYSPDGVHWTRPFTHPVLNVISDTGQSAFWDARLGKYVAYIRARLSGVRFVGRTESDDFQTWTAPRVVYRDPSNRQIYSMGVTLYQDVYIGTPWIFTGSKEETPNQPVMWPELAVSRDGIQWSPLFAGKPLISTGPPGSNDSAQIRMSSSLIVLDDKIALIYGQTNRGHVGDMRVDVGMATMRLDGFAAMTAGDAEGTILTKPLQFSAGRLCVNAKVDPGGYLGADLVDAEGKTVAGYDTSSCARVQGDMLRAPVEWNGRTTVPRSDNGGYRIRFRLKNAKLYSFWIERSGT